MRRARLVPTALLLVAACATSLTGCDREATHPRRQETEREVKPTVGATVALSDGFVTLKSATTSPPPEWNGGTISENLWLSLEFRNTSDSTVTVGGFRGAPEPLIRTATGNEVRTTAKLTRFTGGTGGWGFGRPEEVALRPYGVVYANFGVELSKDEYSPGSAAIEVAWQPTGSETAVFELP